MKEKLYLRRISPVSDMGSAYAVFNKEGEIIASHFCSDDRWAKYDLGPRKENLYNEKYPNGFEIVSELEGTTCQFMK